MPASTEGSIYNSPWNIAANFEVDMSFSPAEIATMLAEYEKDHGTGMDMAAIAEGIHEYTSGYPFLVSRICQCIDEKLNRDWTLGGIREAVSVMLEEKNTLFDDLSKNLENNRDLSDFLYDLLILGKDKMFNYAVPVIDLGHMYGYIRRAGGDGSGKTVIDNRIFEIYISDYFISKGETTSHENRRAPMSNILAQDVIRDDRFDMELCLRKFAEHYAETYAAMDAPFLEREGRLLFLSYIKPLINGRGFYHIESGLTDLRRMDLVIDFGPDQFIVELKLWRGEARHEEAYGQLAGYLDSKNADTGYLLTFDFRKGMSKQPRAEWVDIGGEESGGMPATQGIGAKRIFDVVV
jgi:hypothetical protein